LVPHADPSMNNLTRASLAHLHSVGLAHPNHHAIMAGLDAHAAAKRKQAVAASMPKAPKSFGSLGDSGGGGIEQTGLLSSGGGTGVPAANAGDTGLSPLKQRTSGGLSRVPNGSSGFNRRGGPQD
jgi:hypothetical protein